MRRQANRDAAHELRFHGEHHHLGSLHRGCVVGRRLHRVVAHQPLQLILARIRDNHALRL